jgi:hypothetical protein
MAKDKPLTWKQASEAVKRTEKAARDDLKAGKISRREYWEGKR